MTEYQLLAAMEHAFDHVIEATDAFIHQYDPKLNPLWRPHQEKVLEGNDAKAWLSQALTDFWYQDGQDGRTTRPYLGVIAANENLVESAREINRCKQLLADHIARIRKEFPNRVSEIKATLPFRHPRLHDHLIGAGLARLHLKQCWRQIPIAPAPTDRIRLAWYSSGRSIKKITVADARGLLDAFDQSASHIQIQQQRLSSLDEDEPLAQIQTQAPLMRANLFYQEPLPDGRIRQAMNIALPLIVPVKQTAEGKYLLPKINTPPEAPTRNRTRAQRSDALIDEEPILPSIRIHRYKKRKSSS